MKKNDKNSKGYYICKSLTEKQLISLLDEIFSQLDEERRGKILGKLDNDISATLTSIFSLKDSPQEETLISVVSDEKCIEEWTFLWEEWERIVSMVKEEDNPYLVQEDEWDEPSFRGQDLMSDLGKIGEKMLPLINKLFVLNVSKDNIFDLKLEELDREMNYYDDCRECIIPECMWYGTVLGSSLTEALLEWEWLVVRSKNLSAGEYLFRFLELEEKFDNFSIDMGTYAEFLANLPDEYGREVYEYIRENRDKEPWVEKLEVATFIWNDIYYALACRFNEEHYLEMCRERFSEDWQLGVPLFENYMKEEKYIEGEKTLEEIFEIRIRREGGGDTLWRPEKTLLAEYLQSNCAFYFSSVRELLINWISVCEKLGMEQRKRALEIQIAVFEKPEEWNAVLELFRNLDNSPFNSMSSELFKSWQNFIFEETVSSLYTPGKEEKETWIHWLFSASFEEDKEWFKEKVLSWIKNLLAFYETFDIQQELFYMFTADTGALTGIKKEYPRLFKFIIEDDYEKLRFTSSRRDFMRKMEPEVFIEPVLDWWRKHIIHMVPDPSKSSSSRYAKHARMLSVVRELSNEDYLNILRDWKFKHKRKTSLWREIKELGLPVEGKW